MKTLHPGQTRAGKALPGGKKISSTLEKVYKERPKRTGSLSRSSRIAIFIALTKMPAPRRRAARPGADPHPAPFGVLQAPAAGLPALLWPRTRRCRPETQRPAVTTSGGFLLETGIQSPGTFPKPPVLLHKIHRGGCPPRRKGGSSHALPDGSVCTHVR